MTDQRKQVKDYYSQITTEQEGEMATQICSLAGQDLPREIKRIRSKIPKEIKERFYGCGSPIPDLLEGLTVLDLGCGTGLDVYTLSYLVGEKGRVIGVDMNPDQLAIAQKYQDKMARKFGYQSSNVSFKQGYIEDLKALGIDDDSIDIVVSNCVINLSPKKEEVFSEIWRILKPSGELYFSDIFADRRLPEELSQNTVLLGECLAGAMYQADFRRLMQKLGWLDFRYTANVPAPIGNGRIEKLIGNIGFVSATVRAFKLPNLLEDACEEYGQIAIYQGGIPGHEDRFYLDLDHPFDKGLPAKVCGNTCAMLEHSRFAPYFKIIGDRSQHFGAFDCQGGSARTPVSEDQSTSSCCC
ncbi:methyltransferase domain-containing protein [Aerococcus sp. UMB1112A]|uniref:methyltransferase domain-containing protein n=1 Tax=Aerococcus sp. UMB1112A TaxID=3050609 RepID=UPI002550C57B|nr:methyltransferase domain-containing protein [Aerococcus sp. UMB1112A]MDK8501920.1 methyltransferase domain-containing protein [Aerococcus sp. UMB1112A]